MRRYLLTAVLAASVTVSAALGVWGYRQAAWRQRALEAQQRAEAAALDAEGLVVAEQARASALGRRVRALAEESEGLREQLARLERTSPGARPELVLEGRGETVRVECPPAPPEPSPAAVKPDPASPAREYLAFDPGFDVVGLETEAGNHVLVGEMFGVRPGTDDRIWEAPVRADLTRYWRAPPPPPAADGWGARIQYRRGWNAGPAWEAPPLRWRGTQLDASVDVTFGADGLVVGGTVIVRR